MNDIWDLGMLQVFLSKTGITTGKPCLFSSSVCKKHSCEYSSQPRSVHGLLLAADYLALAKACNYQINRGT